VINALTSNLSISDDVSTITNVTAGAYTNANIPTQMAQTQSVQMAGARASFIWTTSATNRPFAGCGAHQG
jgi:hypothetical protein